MSISDVSKIGNLQPVRGAGADGKSLNDSARHPAKSDAAPGAGVSVETRGSVSAGSPPIDTDRVSEIREALKDGSYPLVPSKIADAMIAARLMLSTPQ